MCNKPTKDQQKTLLMLYNRLADSRKHRPGDPSWMSYYAFRRTAKLSKVMNCLLVPWCGMIVGIEPDGHPHT